MSKKNAVSKGKTIRDSIHGDIYFPKQFLDIIDTSGFQRLRRIHQLSVAYLVFPGAGHTRFSHSIGTYFVMQKIVQHFRPIMENLNLKLEERDINLALAAGLLHDIGHGPFSHAFEDAIPDSEEHEWWTIKIITDQESNINRILKRNFDKEFPEDLADLIRKEKSVKDQGLKQDDYNKMDLFFILSSLISSQLDADRMDYLLRDSQHTGATFGTIDIERLISSMTLTVYKNNYYVCFLNKFTTDIEKYLLARYQMTKEIYLHPVKCEMEIIIKKILERAILNINHGDEFIKETIPQPLLKLFNKKEITVQEYVSLDDNVLLAMIASWMEANDQILSRLCSCVINRQKYSRINILNNTLEDISAFKKQATQILSKYDYHINAYKNEYFWVECNNTYSAYKENKDNIWILKNDYTLSDLCKESKLINERLNGTKTMTFIDYDILEEVVGQKNGHAAKCEMKDLVNDFHNTNHIEIEKKYIFADKAIFDKVKETIKTWGEYVISDTNSHKTQIDYYYDTEDQYLLNQDKTLRFRKTEDDCKLTIKTPIKVTGSNDNGTHNQNERFEYERSVKTDDKNDHKDYIIKYLSELDDDKKWNNLKKLLTITNQREEILLSKESVEFEMVFDDLQYQNLNGVTKSDYQIEIELKSDYIHRINLKMFSDYLEKRIPELESVKESKYKRGTRLTQL